MYLCQTAYYSTPEDLNEETIRDILEKSREKNARLNVTGALAYNGERFMQVLEGERSTLSHLLVQIANDKRHKDFVILGLRSIDERVFSSWSMAYVAPSDIIDYIVTRYSIDARMNPGAMTYESVVGALRSLCS